jgi:hypothetical protein
VADAVSPGRAEQVVVRDEPARSRYEIVVDGERAGFAAYERVGAVMTIPHTEVEPRFEGRGLGARLARFALDDARRQGWRVVPRCPFVASYIARHPEYDDLVAR